MAQMSWNEACQLDPSLVSVESAIDSPMLAETISGLTNLCWKLSFFDQPPVIWRPVTSVTQAFSISRIQEFQVLKLLEKQSTILTPRAQFVNNQGLLVEWLEGQLLDSVSDDTLLRLTTQIHQADLTQTPILPFLYTARVDHYWLQLLNSPLITKNIEELYGKWRRVPNIAPVDSTLCHFDLGAHNLIKNNLGYQVIDWEYASLADPRIELAMLVDSAEAPLAPFVAQYCKMRNIADADIDIWIDGVRAWQPRVLMMSLLWFCLAYRYHQDNEYLANIERIVQQVCCGDHCLSNEDKQ